MYSEKDKQGFAIIAVIVVVLAGVLVFRGSRKPVAAGADNCVGTPNASTAIVIDRSDDVPEQTLDEIRSRALAYVTDSVQDNERVSVFTVTDSSSRALRPLVSICRPRRTGNPLDENVSGLAQRYRTTFEAPVNKALSLGPGTSDQSPIAQTLTDISLSRYLRSRKNSLIVFSDMLENTPRFSLYRCTDPSDVIARYRNSRIGARERPQFRNTSVQLNVIPRLDQLPAEITCRDKLWTWFFGDDSGSTASLSIDYLPGGPAIRQKAEVHQP